MPFAPPPIAELVNGLADPQLEAILVQLRDVAQCARVAGCRRPRIRRILGLLLFDEVGVPERCNALPGHPELREQVVNQGLIPLAELFRQTLTVAMAQRALGLVRATAPDAFEVTNSITRLTAQVTTSVQNARVAPIAHPYRTVAELTNSANLLATETAPEFIRSVQRLRISVAPTFVLLGVPLGKIGSNLGASPKYGYEFRAWSELRPEPFRHGKELALDIVPPIAHLFSTWQRFEPRTRDLDRKLRGLTAVLEDPNVPLHAD